MPFLSRCNLYYLLLIFWLGIISCHQKESPPIRYKTVDYLTVRIKLDSLNAILRRARDTDGTYQQPFVKLSNGKKELLFMGTNHSENPEHPQFRQLEKLFREFSPEIAFNEGGQIAVDRKFVSRDAAAADLGEIGVLKYLSDSAHIKMINGDLEEEMEFPALLKTVPQDELYLYIAVERYLNMYGYGHYPGLSLQESFDQKFIPYLETGGFKLTAEHKQLSYLKDLYKKYLHADIRLDSIIPISEYYLTDTGVFGKVGRATKEIRDQALLEKIDKALDQYDRVIIAFGASHVFAVAPALTQIINRERK